MNAFAIKCIPNVEHTQRVLETRRALRLVPPSEGVWPASAAGTRQGENSRSEVEGEACQSGGEAATPNPSEGNHGQ